MLLQKQRELKDCWRTCIASILSLPAKEVPHFYQMASWDTELADGMARSWLNERGLHLVCVQFHGDVPFKEVLNICSKVTNGLPYILSGTSQREKQNHAVVCRDSSVIMDPLTGLPESRPFVGACKEGFWVLEIVVKAVE